jgi:AraC-like DNA-binding protein
MLNYAELQATPPLDSLIRCFWFLSGDSLGAEPQVVVPDGRLEIILHLADPFYRIQADGPHVQPRALLSGQLTAPITLRAGVATDIVGIRFRTAESVLAFPLSELTDRVESLDAVAPKLSVALYAAAQRARTPQARAAALSQVLASFVRRTPDALASAVVRSLDTTQRPKVGLIAGRFGVTARTLERKVRESTGLPPNVMRRVLRFRRAFRMLDGAAPGTWACVALRAGYFDQAHLIRDFRQFAGAPPSEFFGNGPELARAILAGEDEAAA